MLNLKGVIPPMITPFLENGDVDYEGFADNIRKWNGDKLAGYLVNGSNSETAYLSEEEKLELVRLTVECAAPGRHVMAGTGLESVRETVRFTNKCAKLGIDSALILTPFYYINAMDSKAMIRFFTAVADNADVPVLIYNVTRYTHVNIQADAVAALSRHPNIVGMKDSNGDVGQHVAFMRVIDPSFQIIPGSFAAWYPALTLGLDALITAIANNCPNPIAEVQELFDAGDMAGARALYRRLFPVNASLAGKYGIPGLKYAATRQGYTGGYVRNPLIDSSESEKREIDQLLAEAFGKI